MWVNPIDPRRKTTIKNQERKNQETREAVDIGKMLNAMSRFY